MVAFPRLGNPSCGSTGVNRPLRLLVICLLWLPILLRAATSLENARRAQAMLGPTTWSRVIGVENRAAHSAYPSTVYALVFEEGGILWFYTDTDGTQSFSLHLDRLTEEKADFGPLLRDIDPGFVAYALVPEAPLGRGEGQEGALPNGCVVESLAALQDRVERGERIERARLLSCYVDTPVGRRGHTVLTYETPRGLFLLDPARSPDPRAVTRAWADNPMTLAALAVPQAKIAQARWVPTSIPLPVAMVAAVDYSDNDPVPGMAPRLMR